MTITVQVHIGKVINGPKNVYGVGVSVVTASPNSAGVSDEEGATWVGICMAINDYMQSRGATDFDCLKQGAAFDELEQRRNA